MDEEQQFIEYLESIKAPQIESPGHRLSLRRKLLNEMERRQKMASGKRLLRVVYIVAALVCLSALAFSGTAYIRKWRFKGEKDGAYIFETGPEEVLYDSVVLSPIKSVAAFYDQKSTHMIDSESREQAEKDLMEIEKLKAEGKRELLATIEKKTDKDITIKIRRYRYVLSDGREIIGSEATGDDRSLEEKRTDARRKLEQIKKDYEEKARRARQEGKREIAKVFEHQMDGKVFTTYIVVYKMPDGSEITLGEGDHIAEELQAYAGQEFKQLAKDLKEKKGEFLGTEEREIEGRRFSFTRRKFKLSDGREIIYSEGKPSENK